MTATQPIQPQNPPPQPATAATAPIAPAAASTTQATVRDTETVQNQARDASAQALTTEKPELTAQRRTSRIIAPDMDPDEKGKQVGDTDPYSVSVTFLSGLYKGKTMSVGQWLGAAAPDPSHSWSAEWEAREGDGIRAGLNFKKLGDRTFQIKLYFYDVEYDIAFLAEQLACLTQVSPKEKTPPLLMYRQGKLVASPVVCTSVSVSYSEPLSAERGYKVAEADLSFQLIGGANSDHALGKPLIATALTDFVESLSEEEREKQASQAVAELVLAPCLGEVGNEQLRRMIENDWFDKPNQVRNLDDQTLVQLAVAGMIPTEVLNESAINERLRKALANVMAASEPGLGSGSNSRSRSRFAEAILSGDQGRVAEDLRSQAIAATTDAQEILSAIQSQDLGDAAEIFTGPSATRLRAAASCGLQLRQTQAITPDSPEDGATLQAINQFLASSSTTDEQVKERFGLRTDAQVRWLRGAAPYVSKEAFIQRGAELLSGVTGHSAWAAFSRTQPTPPPTGGGSETPPDGGDGSEIPPTP